MSSSTRPSSSWNRRARLPSPSPTVARNLAVLREYAARAPAGKRRALRLRFRVSPVAILGEDKVEAIEVVRNELVADEAAACAQCRRTSAR